VFGFIDCDFDLFTDCLPKNLFTKHIEKKRAGKQKKQGKGGAEP